MYWKVSVAGILLCWMLLAVIGESLTIRQYLYCLSGIVTWSIITAIRGPAWYMALQVGRCIERHQRTQPELRAVSHSHSHHV